MCGNFYFDVANFEVGGFIKKTQTSKYLENERSFFLQMKKVIHYALRAIIWQIMVF